MKHRVESIDFLRSVCILLMVLFHLAYIGDKYPYLKQVVYTFHMPVFLLISGYLAHTDKSPHRFARSVWGILLPYLIMETGYVVMSSLLPVRERVDALSLPLLLEKVFLAPMGPYWYLHSLVLFYAAYYAADRCCPRRWGKVPGIALLALCCLALSAVELVSMANAIYFIGGAALSTCRMDFERAFRPSFWIPFPLLLLLCSTPGNLDRYSLPGILITYLVISLLMETRRHLPPGMLAGLQTIGRNTFPILLFSPLFTITSKLFLPVFSFDRTGCCFALVATTFSVAGSLFVARLLDLANLSRLFCGRERMLI